MPTIIWLVSIPAFSFLSIFSHGEEDLNVSTCMYGKKFKINDQVIILYDDKEFVIPEELKFEDLGECSPVVDATIPAFRYNDFLTSLFTGKSTQDKVLDSEGINSFQDLQYAYNLVRNKALNKPRRVRDYVVEKYTKLLEFYD